MAALNNFLKDNISGPVNKLFLAGYIKDIATAQNKWLATLKVVKDMVVWNSRLVMPAIFISSFLAMGKAVRSILHDTGSLDAALRRMAAIQGFQRQFAPLLGGLAAAKQRVAELVNFTATHKLFSFEEVAGAAHNLEVLTRGVYSGTEALGTMQTAAIASGNSIGDTSDAVGGFYDALRSGQPVGQAAERLRQMGLISQTAATQMDQLQQSGASTQEVFSALTNTLGKAQQGPEDLGTVNARHAQAVTNLQEQFGKPFTSDDRKNTQNYTDAMNALAPTVGKVAGFFAILTNGLSDVKSSMAKAAAENPKMQKGLEYGAKAIGIFVTAGALFSALKIPGILNSWGKATLAWSASATEGAGAIAKLTTVAKGLAGTLSTGLGILGTVAAVASVVAIVVVAIGVWTNYQKAQEEAAKALRDLAAAHRETEAAMKSQIATMQTLADYHEALTKAMGLEQAALEDLNKARAEAHANNRKWTITGAGVQSKSAERMAIEEAENPKVVEANLAHIKALKTLNALRKQGPAGLTSETGTQKFRQDAQRAIQAEEDAFQERLSKGGSNRASMLRERASVLQGRELLGAAGVKAGVSVEKRKVELEIPLGKAEAAFKRDASPKNFDAVTAAKVAIAQAGLQAPLGTSTNLATRAQMIRASQAAAAMPDQGTPEARRARALGESRQFNGAGRSPRDAAELDARAEVARAREAETATRSRQMRVEAEAAEREQQVTRTQGDLAIAEHQARRRGDAQGARSAADEALFGQHYEQNRGAGFGDEESRRRALLSGREEIAQNALKPGSIPQIVGSMRRVGGGGEVYSPSAGDPMLQTAKRQEGFLEQANRYLKNIEKKVGGGVK